MFGLQSAEIGLTKGNSVQKDRKLSVKQSHRSDGTKLIDPLSKDQDASRAIDGHFRVADNSAWVKIHHLLRLSCAILFPLY